MPELSIIVPVYNTEKYLPKCIESILNQTFKDFELILVDDGSVDLSLKICEKYSEPDKRITVLSQKNQGPSAARNAALKIAKGEFIGFVDSDDFIEPQTYETALKEMKNGADTVFWGVNVFSDDNLNTEWFDNYYNNNEYGKKNLTLDKRLNIAVVPWNKIFRNSVIKEHEIDFPEGRLYEDNAFWWKYTAWCKNIFFIPEKLYFYNMRNSSLRGEVNIQRKELEKDRIFMVENVYDYYKKNKIAEENRELFEKLLAHSFNEAYRQSFLKEDIVLQACELLKKMHLEYSEDKEIQKILLLKKALDEDIEQFKNKLSDGNDYALKVIDVLYSENKADYIIYLIDNLKEYYSAEFDRILGDTYYFLKNEPRKAMEKYLKYTETVRNNSAVYNVLSDIYGLNGDVFNQLKYKQKALNV